MSSDFFLTLAQLLPRHHRQVVLLVIRDLAFPHDEDDLQPLRAQAAPPGFASSGPWPGPRAPAPAAAAAAARPRAPASGPRSADGRAPTAATDVPSARSGPLASDRPARTPGPAPSSTRRPPSLADSTP